jgi:hypothetical protein
MAASSQKTQFLHTEILDILAYNEGAARPSIRRTGYHGQPAGLRLSARAKA